MKRRIAVALTLLCLLPALACAQRVSIAELKQSAPDYWEGEYTVGEKTVSFSAPVYVPDVQAAPVLRAVRSFGTEVGLALYARDIKARSERSIVLQIERSPQTALPEGCIGGITEVFHNLWEAAPEADLYAVYAEGQEISLGEVCDMLEEMTREIYGEEYGLVPDNAELTNAWRRAVLSGGEKQPGELVDYGGATGKGAYKVNGMLTLRGIPLIGSPTFHQGQSGWADSLISTSFAGSGALRYRAQDCFAYSATGWRETETVCADIPLCPFETVREAVERLIAAGTVRTVHAVYLGYVVWLDPQQDYPQNPDRDRAKGILMPALLVPTWVVECAYGAEPVQGEAANEGIYDYRRNERNYERVMVNAQTGEVYDPWDMDSRRGYAPQIETW